MAPKKLTSYVLLLGVLLLAGSRNEMLAQEEQPTCIAPPPGLASWWPGDGNAEDLAGAHAGTQQGGATFAPGVVDQAFSLDGVDDFVDFGTAVGNFGTDDFTLDLWVNFATLINVSLNWLHGKYLLAAILGAVGGPLAYWAGDRLGAIEIAQPLVVPLLAIGLAWGMVTPGLFWIARWLQEGRFSGRL